MMVQHDSSKRRDPHRFQQYNDDSKTDALSATSKALSAADHGYDFSSIKDKVTAAQKNWGYGDVLCQRR
jgi:hypothetical protein